MELTEPSPVWGKKVIVGVQPSFWPLEPITPPLELAWAPSLAAETWMWATPEHDAPYLRLVEEVRAWQLRRKQHSVHFACRLGGGERFHYAAAHHALVATAPTADVLAVLFGSGLEVEDLQRRADRACIPWIQINEVGDWISNEMRHGPRRT